MIPQFKTTILNRNESEEEKRLRQDISKMAKCLNDLFKQDKMPYQAENLNGLLRVERIILDYNSTFSFRLD